MTNQDTCTEGFAGFVKDQMVEKLRDDLSELVSNCLAGVPIQNQRRRRRLLEEDSDISAIQDGRGFPKWMSRSERSLLQMPVSSIQADIIVSQDGNDTYKTVKNLPQYSTRRTIIYVKAGRFISSGECNGMGGVGKRMMPIYGWGLYFSVVSFGNILRECNP